jgi:ketosteroid isomerase-like protein
VNEQDRIQIRDAVERRMASFEAAERALDALALVQHFSDAGDFYMYNDGQRLTFASVAAAVGQAFPMLRVLDGGFTELQVHVLAADAALATARFREAITAHDGTVVRQQGAASWLWRARGGEWKIAYGHVDHYPDSAPNHAA